MARRRRLQKTLFDYMVIAISPALIMVLVGSLVFFLLTVFYDGDYPERLKFIMAMFVMGSVAIGRISIEEGKDYALLFALPLGVVVGIAVLRFVADSHWLLILGTIGLIWWSTHKLTWDCTVIDEQEDASGEGLLQNMGLELDGPTSAEADDEALTELEGMTSREQPPSAAGNLWQQFLEKRRRPHAPGLWVVYFSVAALALFGFCQSFIPADSASHRQVFHYLCVYTASGLGLLLTTSFLGLRRYLRQRHLEMPAEMASVWLGVGCVMILALLTFAALLPRPRPGRATEPFFTFGSPDDLQPSRVGIGNDGPEDEQLAARTRDDDQKSGKGAPKSGKKGDQNGGDKKPDSGQKSQGDKSKQGDTKEKSGDKSDDSRNQQSADQQNGQRGDRSERGNQKKGQQDDAEGNDAQQRNGENAEDQDSRSKNRSSQAARFDSSTSSSNKSQDSRKSNPQRRTSSPPRGASSPSQVLSSISRAVGALLKLVFYAVLAVVGIYLLWKYWDRVVASWYKFLAELRDFWNKLFGGRSGTGEEAEPAEEPLLRPRRSFAQFGNPFATGMASRVSPDELVKYSFEALEAWAWENGCPRHDEQTPHEFARQVAHHERSLGQDAVHLAELYSCVAYAKGSLAESSVRRVEKFWQQVEG